MGNGLLVISILTDAILSLECVIYIICFLVVKKSLTRDDIFSLTAILILLSMAAISFI